MVCGQAALLDSQGSPAWCPQAEPRLLEPKSPVPSGPLAYHLFATPTSRVLPAPALGPLLALFCVLVTLCPGVEVRNVTSPSLLEYGTPSLCGPCLPSPQVRAGFAWVVAPGQACGHLKVTCHPASGSVLRRLMAEDGAHLGRKRPCPVARLPQGTPEQVPGPRILQWCGAAAVLGRRGRGLL